MKKWFKIISLCLIIILSSTIIFNLVPRVKYKIEDKTAIVDGYYGYKKSIVIADTYKGYIVDEIGERAFYNCNKEEITLGNNIKYTGKLSFALCKNLEKFVFNKRLEYPGNNMFYSSKKLEEVIFPTDASICEISGSMFFECTSLKNIRIPESVYGINSLAFYGCSSLSYIEMPSSIEYISKDAFKNTNLERILIYGNSSNYLEWIDMLDSKIKVII